MSRTIQGIPLFVALLLATAISRSHGQSYCDQIINGCYVDAGCPCLPGCSHCNCGGRGTCTTGTCAECPGGYQVCSANGYCGSYCGNDRFCNNPFFPTCSADGEHCEAAHKCGTLSCTSIDACATCPDGSKVCSPNGACTDNCDNGHFCYDSAFPACSVDGSSCVAVDTVSSLLPISASFQETAVWCWVAVSEMIFRYVGLKPLNADYQCGIVNALGGVCAQNCFSCEFPAGQLQNLRDVLMGYPDVVRSLLDPSSQDVTTVGTLSALSWESVKAEIDARRPVVAAISPSMIPSVLGPEHVALIVGYATSFGRRDLIVNDPFPFSLTPFAAYGDPYLRAGGFSSGVGQYRIAYDRFRSEMLWTQTIHQIEGHAAGSGSDLSSGGGSACNVSGKRASSTGRGLIILIPALVLRWWRGFRLSKRW